MSSVIGLVYDLPHKFSDDLDLGSLEIRKY